MGNISLVPCKSYKQTLAFASVHLLDLQLSWEIFPVFSTYDNLSHYNTKRNALLHRHHTLYETTLDSKTENCFLLEKQPVAKVHN